MIPQAYRTRLPLLLLHVHFKCQIIVCISSGSVETSVFHFYSSHKNGWGFLSPYLCTLLIATSIKRFSLEFFLFIYFLFTFIFHCSATDGFRTVISFLLASTHKKKINRLYSSKAFSNAMANAITIKCVSMRDNHREWNLSLLIIALDG